MTFDNVHHDTVCNCIDDAISDTTNEYVRKLRKNIVEEKDFLSHWERGLYNDKTECEEICSYKGVSINIYKAEFEQQIKDKFTNTKIFNPKKGGTHIIKFKLKQDAGKVKFAPEDNDQSHYNFFKADNFTLSNLAIIEIIKF